MLFLGIFKNLLNYVGGIIMDNLKWCFNQKKGIKVIELNLNVAKAYLGEAKKDFSLIDKKEPKWNIL